MKILKIFGAVVAVHLLAFIFIFASPGCSSGPRTMPTPDATVPPTSSFEPATTPAYNNSVVSTPTPIDLGTPSASAGGHASPTRPGSPNAVAVSPVKQPESVAPVATYTVERGDSLWSIAKKHGMTVAELAKANSISTGTALKPGRKLIVPVKPGAAAPATAEAAPSTSVAVATTPARPAAAEGGRHIVQVGESLGVIARKYGVTVGELAAANSITDPSKVRAGQALIIPGYKGTVSRAAARSAGAAPATAKPAPATNGPAPATSANKPAETPPAPAPHFDLTPPPPGQDLDAGLKPSETDVPTIKVEEATPKN